MRGRTTTKNRPAFGERLAVARQAAGLSQEALAKKLGVDRAVVRHCERRVTDPKVGFVLKCCAALNVSFGELIDGASPARRDRDPALERFMTRLLSLDKASRNLGLRISAAAISELRRVG